MDNFGTAAAVLVNRAYNRGLTPPPRQTVSEWADDNRELGTSVSAVPGIWKTSRVPYMRQVMDCLSPGSAARTIALMKGSQIGGTEASLNWVGHTVYYGLGSMLIVLPSQETAKEWSKQRLSQLTEDTTCLQGKILDQRRRDSGNTSFAKKYPGGFLKIAWATSAKKLRSTPAGLILGDEVDGFSGDTQGEGDPVALLKRRFTNYPLGKLFLISTPTLRAQSRIEREFQAGDQRYYFVPCPHCLHFQRLVMEQLRWEKGNPSSAAYKCIGCKELIPDRHKGEMLASGMWVATRDHPKLVDGGFPAVDKPLLEPILDAMERETAVSFHLSALYSPPGWYSWGQLAHDFDTSEKNPALLKVFVNTVLGETWQERGEAPDWEILQGRLDKTYQQYIVPLGGLFLTAGVDVQSDRLEIQIVAWGRNKESWLIDHVVLPGRPSETKVWQDLTALLNTTYRHASGVDLSIVRMAVDSGYSTQDVYNWGRIQGPGRVLIIKGQDHGAAAIGQPSPVDVNYGGKKIKRGIKLWPVNTHILKSELYGWLNVRQAEGEKYPPYPQGYCHLYEGAGDEFLRQLTAEQYVTRLVKGYKRGEWVKTRERNEALDTRIYARAAAAQFGLDRLGEPNWQALERDLNAPLLASASQQQLNLTGELGVTPDTVSPVPATEPPVVQNPAAWLRARTAGKPWLSRS